jgi:hypothetical protein
VTVVSRGVHAVAERLTGVLRLAPQAQEFTFHPVRDAP